MKQLVAWIQAFALQIGGPGLFIIAFLDSSFLSLPEINDLLIVLMVVQHKERMLYYATMATLGSVAGCLTLYYLGRRGGEAFLRRRFKGTHVDRGLALYRRFGVLAVIIPALLPPPAPFKIFVLLAGVAKMNAVSFSIATALGRGVRYFGEGWLAVQYGEAALDYVHQNGARLSLWLAGIVLVGGVAYYLWSRRTRPG